MIGIFLGEQHSGKTLALTYFAYDYYKKGFEIYSNYNLEIPHKKLTVDVIKDAVYNKEQFNKTVFVIDEIYLILDSRNFSKNKNKIFSYFLLQSSKRDVHIFGTAQYFNTVEKRFRENIKFQCYCNRVYKNEFGEYAFVESEDRELTEEENEKLYIKLNFIIRKQDTYNVKEQYLKAKPIFNLYDNRELLNIDGESDD